ncbi:MAG: hypothetical protein ACHQAY_00810 [Hyphomicrobiales bacterium]
MTLAALLLGACADMPVFHAPAQLVGAATTPREPEGFVKENRPEQTDFTSVGIVPAHPPDKPRDAAGVKQLQAELQAQRDAGHAILQTLSPQTATPTAAQTPEQKAKAKLAARQKSAGEAAAKPKGEGQSETQAPQ